MYCTSGNVFASQHLNPFISSVRQDALSTIRPAAWKCLSLVLRRGDSLGTRLEVSGIILSQSSTHGHSQLKNQNCVWAVTQRRCLKGSTIHVLEYPLASFPDLPHFYLLFAITIIQKQKTGEKKMGKAWVHSSREWMQGGRRREGPIIFTSTY